MSAQEEMMHGLLHSICSEFSSYVELQKETAKSSRYQRKQEQSFIESVQNSMMGGRTWEEWIRALEETTIPPEEDSEPEEDEPEEEKPKPPSSSIAPWAAHALADAGGGAAAPTAPVMPFEILVGQKGHKLIS